MKKVAIYTRVSTVKQKTDLQRADLQEYAASRGYEVYKIYQETVSAGAKERKAFNQLVSDAKKRKFDIVLVWKFDRLARSLRMFVNHLELLSQAGIDFISYKENIDTTTTMGKLVFYINAAYAEFERDIRERTKNGIRVKRAKTGRWGRKALDSDTQNKIKALRASKSISATAAELHVSTATVIKYQ